MLSPPTGDVQSPVERLVCVATSAVAGEGTASAAQPDAASTVEPGATSSAATAVGVEAPVTTEIHTLPARVGPVPPFQSALL